VRQGPVRGVATGFADSPLFLPHLSQGASGRLQHLFVGQADTVILRVATLDDDHK
jgi:hypothetical protein